MILKASQRSGGKQLGLHLMKTEENEHVEIHEVSGFLADDLMGAMKEAHALSLGTKCRQYLFSVSLNPPAGESVRVEVFENALRLIEERNGLVGQPRMVVFHEKEGRRHCHAVWSRVDPETMTAKPLHFFKSKLREIAKQLFIENGWVLPKGFQDSRLRDPRNFTLEEWQRAKRVGVDPKLIKQAAQEAWSVSDDRKSFASALEERGLFLARGDRRGHVVVSADGEVFAVSRLVDQKTKEISQRLGVGGDLPSVDITKRRIADEVGQRLKGHIAEAKRIAANNMKPMLAQRDSMADQHRAERQRLDAGLKERALAEQKSRAARVRGGALGVWDIITGRYSKTRKRNEAEAFFAMERDRTQRHDLVQSQLAERHALQSEIVLARESNARQVLGLYRHAAQFRQMREGLSRGPENSLDIGR